MTQSSLIDIPATIDAYAGYLYQTIFTVKPWTDVNGVERSTRLVHTPGLGSFCIYDAPKGTWVEDDGGISGRVAGEVAAWTAHKLDEVVGQLAALSQAANTSGDPALTEALASGDFSKLGQDTSVAARQMKDTSVKLKAHRSLLQLLSKPTQRAELVRALSVYNPAVWTIENASLWDSLSEWLPVANGVVNLRTGVLQPHSPGFMFTWRIEHSYQPNAQAGRWVQFLSEIMSGDSEMVGFLCRLIGYGITGSTVEQIMPLLVGNGANGKSVFTDTLASVFSKAATSPSFSAFQLNAQNGPQPELLGLKGKRLAFVQEGEEGTRQFSESMVKRITGGDLISARGLYQSTAVSFKPVCLVLLATNHAPDIHGADDGIWRRLRLIHFREQFLPGDPRRDLRLESKLLGEAEGILAWAVAGAVEWFANGLQEPGETTEAARQYRQDNDALGGFLSEVLTAGSDAVPLPLVYIGYQVWCQDNGESRPMTARKLNQQLEARGLVRSRRKLDGRAADVWVNVSFSMPASAYERLLDSLGGAA